MKFTVNMPDIGEGVVEGEVISWLKQVNDTVKQDEPVVIVMTDKATVELPAPKPGRISKHYYQPGEIAIKDKPLYEIDTEETSTTVQAAPNVRKMAQEMNIDLKSVHGTGPEGRILQEDLKPASNEEPLIGIRYLMAEKMTESKNKIPHFSYFDRADATHLVEQKKKLNTTYMPFFIRALSLCIRNFPHLNASVDMEHRKVILHPHQNIGIAMATPLGLIVPVLHNVERMSFEDIVREYELLKTQGASSSTKDGTITISNFGALSGGHFATPIINYPEVAILAVAFIHKEPLVVNDTLCIRHVLNLSWSFDHRIIDGHEATKISAEFVKQIEQRV